MKTSKNTLKTALFFLTAIGASTFAPTVPSAHAQPMTPIAAPDFKVRGLDGSTANLSHYRGRPVVLTLWATWCPACRVHLPVLDATYRRFSRAGLVMLAVSKEDSATLAEYGRRNNFSFPLLMSVGDGLKPYSSSGIPQTYLIDSAGRVVWQELGSSPRNAPVLDALIARDLEQNTKTQKSAPKRRVSPASAQHNGYANEVVRRETIRRETIGGARSQTTLQRPNSRSTKAQRAAWARAQKAKTSKRTRAEILAEAKRVAPKNQSAGKVILLSEDGIAIVR